MLKLIKFLHQNPLHNILIICISTSIFYLFATKYFHKYSSLLSDSLSMATSEHKRLGSFLNDTFLLKAGGCWYICSDKSFVWNPPIFLMTQNVLISFQTGHLLVIFTKLNQSRANMRDRGLIFLGINCLIPIQKDLMKWSWGVLNWARILLGLWCKFIQIWAHFWAFQSVGKGTPIAQLIKTKCIEPQMVFKWFILTKLDGWIYELLSTC